ncbi:MAG: cysteine desulfurase family protein [Acidobacteriota bacterium]|nr:cysteine desulfurase family protein [Acidobacteriota bacterium]
MMKERIYLDNSATTRVDDVVVEAMLPCFRETFGNASSVHIFGQEARTCVETARRSVAELLGADTREIVFTSGGTESDNAAIWGVFRSGYRPGNHIITTKIEHPAVLATCKALESAGAEVTYVPVNASGRVDPASIEAAVRETTLLISVMHANNETGVIQPIEEISAISRRHGILLHTDAVQSVGKIPVKVEDLGVDLLSLSGHKIHGPKGVGVLYIRKGTKLVPFMTGGSHERKRRAGTENVPAIAGLGAAARLARERLPEMQTRIGALRDRFESQVLSRFKGTRVNGQAPRLPNITNLSFEGVDGESAVIALDLEGVAVSTGSACTSGALDPSHVLMAMGLRPEVVQASLRFSLCYHSTDAEIDRAFQILETVVQRLRRLSRRA